MRAALTTTVLALGLLVAVSAGVGQAAGSDPTPAQVRAAVRRAERARTLWATINICDTRRYPHTIGVRGQMPALGFPAWMSMEIQIDFYSQAKKRFVPDPIPDARKLIRLGRSSSGLQQGGAIFVFPPHTGYLNATVNFIWRRSGKLLGQTLRRSTAGHHRADFGSPPHFSAKQCQIR